MKKRQKVLMIIPDYDFGGAQRVFSDQSNFLFEHFELTLCTFNNQTIDRYESKGLKISLNVGAGTNVLEKIFSFFFRIWRLRKIKPQFDFCISHLEGADYVNILSKREEKVICCIHGTKFSDGEIAGWLGWVRKKFVMPYLYKHSNMLVAVSAAIRNELISELKIPPDKVVVINNGFDIKLIEKKAKEEITAEFELLFEDNKTICLCSRLATQKNLQSFIPIFFNVLQLETCKLVVIGDGELKEQLIHQSLVLGLKVFSAHREQKFSLHFDVYFLGNQMNPFPYLSRASIFAFPSAWEGFPLALCEAMVCNIPVVSADCPTGPREILDAAPGTLESINGILLPIPSLEKDQTFYAWVNSIVELLRNKEKANLLMQNAKARVSAFSIENMANAWIEVIRHVSRDSI